MHTCGADKRAILAAGIFDDRHSAIDNDAGVLPGDVKALEPDFGLWIASDDGQPSTRPMISTMRR